MFYGPVALGTTIALMVNTVNGSDTPTAADTNAVTYRIYAPSGSAALLTGSFSTTVVDSQTGLYQATGVALTAGNGFAAGNVYVVRIAYAISATNYVKVQFIQVT